MLVSAPPDAQFGLDCRIVAWDPIYADDMSAPGHRGRPSRTPVELTEFERWFIDQARGDTNLGKYIREAALARAAYELGQRSDDPGRTILSIIKRLRGERTKTPPPPRP